MSKKLKSVPYAVHNIVVIKIINQIIINRNIRNMFSFNKKKKIGNEWKKKKEKKSIEVEDKKNMICNSFFFIIILLSS